VQQILCEDDNEKSKVDCRFLWNDKEGVVERVGGLAGAEGMAGPSTAVRVGLRTFAQDDRVGEGWRRTNTGVSPLPLRLRSGFGRDDSVYGELAKNGRTQRFFALLRMTALGEGWGEHTPGAKAPFFR